MSVGSCALDKDNSPISKKKKKKKADFLVNQVTV